MNNTTIELTIVILCYRSEEYAIDFAEQVKTLAKSLTDSFQIVLVANYIEGSIDNTKEIVKQIAKTDPCYITVTKPKKGMMGWDMLEGFKAAEGNYICVIDGDGQFPIESISKCFHLIKTDEYDLVKTYREKRNDGLFRKIITVVYNILFRILFPGLNSKDINSKPKMIKRSALEKMVLTSHDWFIDAEILLNVRKLNMKFKEFPVLFKENVARKSFVKFGAIFEFTKNMFQYWYKDRFKTSND